jgi:hypothetical protein
LLTRRQRQMCIRDSRDAAILWLTQLESSTAPIAMQV